MFVVWDFFITFSSISPNSLPFKCKASSWTFTFLFVPRFFFLLGVRRKPLHWIHLLSLSLFETFVEALSSSRFGVLPRSDSSAAGIFDSVSLEIITSFMKDIVVKYCHFDSRVGPAAGPDFVSFSFFSSLRYRTPIVSHVFCACLLERSSFFAVYCYIIPRHKFVIFQYNNVFVFVGFYCPEKMYGLVLFHLKY